MRIFALVLCVVLVAAAEPASAAVDRILVEKSARRMTLFDGTTRVAVYRIALGFAPVGDKEREGDGKTPEGVYRISGKNPRSQFHLSLRISYPDAHDRAAAATAGVAPGGDIYVHGTPGRDGPYPPGARISDWTLGCVALTNDEIEEVWRLVSVGTRIEIVP